MTTSIKLGFRLATIWPRPMVFGGGASPLALLASASVALASCEGEDFCESGSHECTAPVVEGQSGGGGGEGGAATSAGTGHDGGAMAMGGAAGAGAGAGGAAEAGEAGTSAEAGAAGSSNPLDDTCDPASPTDTCTLSDDTGIYVDPATGDDVGLGTRDAPFASAAKALSIAADLRKPVYLCNATFDEHVEVSDGVVALRGGYTCPGDERGAWTYAAGERAKFRPISSGIVLTVRGVSELSVSDVEVIAADGVSAGESSVAAFVVTSTDVTFARVTLRAGTGKNGADAVFAPFTLPSAESLNGNPQQNNVAGAAHECECPAGDVTRGGAGSAAGQPGEDGEPDWGAGSGGTLGPCTVARGERGGDAPVNAPGAGAEVSGRLLPNGWSPEPGTDGQHGAAAQGGGGAASPVTNMPGGGGGACGGCGGSGGPGGGGGGSSIALLSLDSSATLRNSTLSTVNAGHGGAGAPGQSGQAGGTGGENVVANACSGGNGGNGGDGAAGGGGAGGVSAGVLSLNSSIRKASVTFATGTPGEGGLGGVPGVNDGINGMKGNELTLD